MWNAREIEKNIISERPAYGHSICTARKDKSSGAMRKQVSQSGSESIGSTNVD